MISNMAPKTLDRTNQSTIIIPFMLQPCILRRPVALSLFRPNRWLCRCHWSCHWRRHCHCSCHWQCCRHRSWHWHRRHRSWHWRCRRCRFCHWRCLCWSCGHCRFCCCHSSQPRTCRDTIQTLQQKIPKQDGHCDVFATSQGPLGLNLESHSLQGRTTGNIFHVFFSWRCRTCSLQCRHPWLQEQTGPTQVHIALTHFNTGEHLITFSKNSKLDLCNYSLRFPLLNQTKPPCPGQHWQLKSRKGVNDWQGRISTTTSHHQSILVKGKNSEHFRRCIVQRWRLNMEQVSHSRHVLISHLEQTNLVDLNYQHSIRNMWQYICQRLIHPMFFYFFKYDVNPYSSQILLGPQW